MKNSFLWAVPWVGAWLTVFTVLGCNSDSIEASTEVESSLMDARAPSRHYVRVSLSGPIGIAELDVNRYRIVDPAGRALEIRDARKHNGDVLLITEAQQAVRYTLTLEHGDGSSGNPQAHGAVGAQIQALHVAIDFMGSTIGEAYLENAVAVDNTHVVLLFSSRLGAHADEPESYEIVLPNLDVTAAELSQDKQAVLLTTSPQEGIDYTVRVHAIETEGVNGNLLDPTRSSASFEGRLGPDDISPRLLSANALDNSSVLLTFDEALDDDAADVRNFSVAPDLVVIGASLSAFNTQILLETAPMIAGVVYTVTLSDRVKDPARNSIDPTFNSATFSSPILSDGTSSPRVVGAVSTSNTSVVVRFSKAMDDAAIDPSNYAIVQENVNSEVGFVGVTGASFVDARRVAVELTTRSQNEVSYVVTVSNVADLAGNPLAARVVSQGVLVDPTRATFAGTPPGPGELVDSDGDGVTDNVEQSGWVVTVILLDGSTSTRQVTSDIEASDTDGDGLSDQLERLIGSDPRQADTDGDSLSDNEEYNAIFSNQNSLDSDGDGIDDFLEVEFFKTNALTADSDGDGYTDDEELFTRGRDPRVADLPEHRVEIGQVRLQIDERFTFTDEDGITQTETSSTSTGLTTEESRTTVTTNGSTRFASGGLQAGIDSCQSDCIFFSEPIGNRWFFNVHAEAGLERFDQMDKESSRAAQEAFEQSLERSREISATSGVTREVVGAGVFVDVMLHNPGDIAISLSNIELTLQTTDPEDGTRRAPVATLLPESTLLTGEPTVFNLGPGESRGPIVFAHREVFPNLVEDLMRAPRGLVTRVANFDLVTADGRNFAFGLQDVRERTAGILIDFGDGGVQQFQAITAGVLNRPRDELRCAPSGDHPNELCSEDADCGTSVPCEGGTIVGGFAGFGGTGRTNGIPLDFLLEDVLQLRRTSPQTIVTGPDGVADTTAMGDDVQVIPVGTNTLSKDAVVVAAGRNLVLETAPSGDDLNPTPPDGIRPGADATVDSIAEGDDVQLIPVGTRGVPEDVVAINAGENGVLDTMPRDDDVADVVTGFEVSRTCDAATPFAILAGPNGIANTLATPGTCIIAFAPDVAGQACTVDLDCGQDSSSTAVGVCDNNDVQDQPWGTSGLSPDEVVISAGADGFVASVPAVDDVFLGPGKPCTADADCGATGLPGGTCAGPQKVVRVNSRRDGQFRRFWSLVLPEDVQYQTDFGLIQVRSGDVIALKFIQDVDRDGLSAEVEFLAGSSDFKRDTDDDTLDDFAEVRIGWEVGVVGSPLRRVFPDPRTPDSDFDGLFDYEEFDLRPTRCACDATGPKSIVGSTGTPCSSDAECAGECLDAVACTPEGFVAGIPCPPCPIDPTLSRTDPRRRDTDADQVSDFDEVFGYLTGAGIMDATFAQVILAGPDRIADTLACPQNHCIEDAGQHCVSDGDCASRQCIRPVFCDDVQVVQPGSGGWDPRTVVVAPGTIFNGLLGAGGLVELDSTPATEDVLEDLGANGAGNSRLVGDDVLFVGEGEPSFESALQCVDGSAFNVDNNGVAGRFAMCGVMRPGPDGVMESQPSVDDVLVPAGSGQRLESTDPLHPDTDMDDVRDGFERILGSSPNDPGDTGLAGDLDRDGLSDRQESSGWNVTVFPVVGSSKIRAVASNPHVPDTDLDGLPDYAELHMPCSDAPDLECPTDPTSADTDGDDLSDLDELSLAQLEQLEAFNGFFPSYAVDSTASAQLGTDPIRADTDDDGLSDFEELFEPVTIALNDGSLRIVTTNPINSDTDQDGTSDSAEINRSAGATDPTDPDTDDDGRFDGVEITNGFDPLVADLLVTLNFHRIEVDKIEDPLSGGLQSEFAWWFLLRAPGVSPNPTRVSHAHDAGALFLNGVIDDIPDCWFARLPIGYASTIELAIDQPEPFILREGESFTIDGLLAELDFASADCGSPPNYIPSYFESECFTRFAETFSFSDLSFGERGEEVAVNAVDGEAAEGGDDCSWRVVISMTVD